MGIRGPGKNATVSTPLGDQQVTAPCSIEIKKWFTNVATVKKMYTAISKQLTIQNEEEILVGFYENDLDFGNIVENSERIKIRQRALGPDTVTFEDDSWRNLLNDDIIKGSVVVTDTAEVVELTEGVDFEMDYTSGKIRRITGGGTGGDAQGTGAGEGAAINSLPVSLLVRNVVKVHYEYYLTTVKDIDYSINYIRGSLSRKQGGSLVSGVKVYVDYKIRDLVRDEAISLSIDQAHTWIISRIGSENEGNLDENLKYGEAYFALFLLSKMSAANLIYEKRNDDIEEAAKELKLISDDYRSTAMSYLRDFIQFPVMSHSGRPQKNVMNE
ncbi:hypothetical protein ACFL6I_09395 [candidate division KSB1 bacterium]